MYKLNKMFQYALIFVCLIALTISATILPFPSTMPKVTQSYDQILKKTWEGIKKRNIDPYTIPLVHRPKSETPHDAVSEGVGYGLILALYCNDQLYFDKIWDAGEKYLWQGEYYNWRCTKDGLVVGTGAATDAEQDIALALIFADQLVKKKVWTNHTSPKNVTYAARAQEILNSMWKNMIENGKYLRPGTNWGGAAFVNPGYFAPAFYRVFDEFDSQDHDWAGLINQCYLSISSSPGYSKGLLPDWMKPDGAFAGKDLGYNSYAAGEFLYKDAIRIYWRLATDYLWYGELRAKAFLKKAVVFLGNPSKANFFQMNGSAVTDTFSLGNGANRFRTEHSHLTVGMWATAAMGAGSPETTEPFSDELLKYYESGSDYWGKSTDSLNEDTLHNEMYFDQFLAWFGASLISGVFTNLWEDLKDSNPSLVLAFNALPEISPYDINADIAPLVIKAGFNKSARWLVELQHLEDSNEVLQFSGAGTDINLQWYGLNPTGKPSLQGFYRVTVSARGLSEPFTKTVWLGKARSLKTGTRLCVDDFVDHDLVPYIGSRWTSYLDSHEGKNGKSVVQKLVVVDQNTIAELRWGYRLDGSSSLGFKPYAALEWSAVSAGGNLNLTALDTIIIEMGANSNVSVSMQLITSNITDNNYFEDSLQLTTQVKEIKIPIKGFKSRWGSTTTTPDLSKLTALRFQVQNIDGSQNEFVLRKIQFTGNLSSLYQDPPGYIAPPVAVRPLSSDVKTANMIVTINKSVLSVRVPGWLKGAEMMLFTSSGKVVFRGTIDNSGSSINRIKNLNAGMYILSLKNCKNRITTSVNYINE